MASLNAASGDETAVSPEAETIRRSLSAAMDSSEWVRRR
jgi:hypothetical protein